MCVGEATPSNITTDLASSHCHLDNLVPNIELSSPDQTDRIVAQPIGNM